MRINIMIDAQLMAQALQATDSKTKEEAVEPGLKMLVEHGQQREIRKLRGRMPGDGDLDEMRSDF